MTDFDGSEPFPKPAVAFPDSVNIDIYRLALVCSKCTRYKVFEAKTRLDALILAKKKRWRLINDAAICPKCPSADVGQYARRR
jgi:hypothetical protein